MIQMYRRGQERKRFLPEPPAYANLHPRQHPAQGRHQELRIKPPFIFWISQKYQEFDKLGDHLEENDRPREIF